MFTIFRNAVVSVRSAPLLFIVVPEKYETTEGWCKQYSEEGYNVICIPYYPPQAGQSNIGLEDSLRAALAARVEELKDGSGASALITFALLPKDSEVLKKLVSDKGANVKACVHYSPLAEDGPSLVLKNAEGEVVPTIFHFSALQEDLHSSLLAVISGIQAPSRPPVSVYPYPKIPMKQPFPLLLDAPAVLNPSVQVKVGRTNAHVDEYVRSATGLAYTRTMDLLKRHIGPYFDLEKLWEMHTYYEFEERDPLKTMSTMVKTPYVNHVPTMTGGVGYADLARFYKYHFTADNVTPPDTEMIPVSRTVGADRIVDEMIFKCTHTTEIDYLLPGIKPTGKPLEIALVAIVAFRGDKLTFEHIYWDQASALVQLGLLDKGLPVAGHEVARKVVDPFGLPSNELLEKWTERFNKTIG